MSMTLPRLSRDERLVWYRSEILAVAPRLLSAMDRCPVSATGGCLDREYWAWATKDFANLDLQRGLLPLAYLFRTSFSGNSYSQSPALLGWLEQGIRFWCQRQNSLGAFDHLYVHENSWMAAAFTLCDLVAVYELIGDDLSQATRSILQAGMRKAADHLVRYDETHGFISNHRAGAAAALQGVSTILQESAYERRAWDLMAEIYKRQSSEGWFLEYQGADPGYQTLDTHYQGLFWLRSGQEQRVLDATEKSLAFMAWFVHPDGSLGGEYGSRGCPHVFPAGFEIFADMSGLAESLAGVLGAALKAGAASGMADADVRNAFVMSTSYTYAIRALESSCDSSSSSEHVSLPVEGEGERWWAEAGLFVSSSATQMLVFGASKGGVLKVFDKALRRLTFSHDGYTAVVRDESVTSQAFSERPECDAQISPETGVRARLDLAADFVSYFPDRAMSPWAFLLFRMFNLTVGRVAWVNRWMRRSLIIGRFLTRRKEAPLRLHRCVELRGNEVLLEDRIDCVRHEEVHELVAHGFFSTVYMASARYYRPQDLAHAWSSGDLSEAVGGQKPVFRVVVAAGSGEDMCQDHNARGQTGEFS